MIAAGQTEFFVNLAAGADLVKTGHIVRHLQKTMGTHDQVAVFQTLDIKYTGYVHVPASIPGIVKGRGELQASRRYHDHIVLKIFRCGVHMVNRILTIVNIRHIDGNHIGLTSVSADLYLIGIVGVQSNNRKHMLFCLGEGVADVGLFGLAQYGNRHRGLALGLKADNSA